MIELRVVGSGFLRPLNVVTIDVLVFGKIDRLLADTLLAEKEDISKRYLVKADMMLSGPSFKRPPNMRYLAIEPGEFDYHDLVGITLVPFTKRRPLITFTMQPTIKKSHRNPIIRTGIVTNEPC